jgi:ABC-type dipeptide/oligopeptide/nickel transport system permease component
VTEKAGFVCSRHIDEGIKSLTSSVNSVETREFEVPHIRRTALQRDAKRCDATRHVRIGSALIEIEKELTTAEIDTYDISKARGKACRVGISNNLSVVMHEYRHFAQSNRVRTPLGIQQVIVTPVSCRPVHRIGGRFLERLALCRELENAMQIRTYLLKRLIGLPPILLGVLTIAFVLSHMAQADPLTSILPERQLGNPEAVAAAKARWGLDKSPIEQYVVYLKNVATGDLGISFRTKRPVLQDLRERLPATLELVIAALLVGSLSGILLGVLAARMRDTIVDHFVRLFALLGSSLPVFWSGLAALSIFSVQLVIMPGPGRLDSRSPAIDTYTGLYTIDALIQGKFSTFLEALSHLILPAAVLGWSITGIISRLVRASMLDVLGQDYILMAKAKGVSDKGVLFHHALRNALIPAITVIGYSFAFLLTGAVLTETIFSWPGIGSYAVDSARALDYPAIMGVTVLGGAAFLLTNLVTDITYIFVDPRIKLQ